MNFKFKDEDKLQNLVHNYDQEHIFGLDYILLVYHLFNKTGHSTMNLNYQ